MARWGTRLTKGAASVQTVGSLNAAGASMRRAKITDITMGCNASPADNEFEWVFQRCTAAPTGATVTPNSTDPADTLASTIVATGTVTAETLTAGAFLGEIPMNTRASFRWVAVPTFELIIPAVAAAGIAIAISAATTTTFGCGAMYEEL
jgi:hypothetical protein